MTDPLHNYHQTWRFESLSEMRAQNGVHPGHSAILGTTHYLAWPLGTFSGGEPDCVIGVGVQWASLWRYGLQSVVPSSRLLTVSLPLVSNGTDLSEDRSFGIQQASVTQDGYMTAAMAQRLNSTVVTSLTISATSPIRIDGAASADLSANRTISVLDATTGQKGAVQLTGDIGGSATNVSVIKLRGATMQTSGGSVPTDSLIITVDSSTINYGKLEDRHVASNAAIGWGKLTGYPTITCTAPLTIGGSSSADLSTNRTLAVSNATTNAAGVVQLTSDLGGTGASPSVIGIRGAGVQTAGGSLVAGKVLQVIGASALDYGFLSNLNLASDAAVAVSKLAAGSNNQVLTSNGTTNAWGSVTSSMITSCAWSTITGKPALLTADAAIVFAAAVTAPQISQDNNTTTNGHATSMTINAQNATGSGSTYGGNIVLRAGSGNVPGSAYLLDGNGLGLSVLTSGNAGGAQEQVVADLPIFFTQSERSGSVGAALLGFDAATRHDPANAIGRDLQIQAETLINSSSSAGNLVLSSGQGYSAALTGSVYLYTGTAQALVLAPGGGHAWGAPSFTVADYVTWAQTTTSSTSPFSCDAAAATNGTYQIDVEMMSSGGTDGGWSARWFAKRVAGVVTVGSRTIIADGYAGVVVPSLSVINNNTLRLTTTPPNSTSTKWTLKWIVRIAP